MKVTKKNKNKKAEEAVATEAVAEETVTETAEEATEATEAEEADEEAEEEAPVEAKTPAPKVTVAKAAVVPQVSVKTTPHDWVGFACTREVCPPPTIGNFSMGSELGILKMSAGTKYNLPRHVAEHLADAGIGVLS